jgi:hypothetical protein
VLMSAVVRIWVQRVIYESTASSDVTAEDQNRLIKYLDEPTTRDITYRELVNRALDDKTKVCLSKEGISFFFFFFFCFFFLFLSSFAVCLQDPRVLLKVVSLLKRYLGRYPPSYETLLYLDHFASSLGTAGGFSLFGFHLHPTVF